QDHFRWAAHKATIVYGASEQNAYKDTLAVKKTNKQEIGIDVSKRIFLLLSRIERRKGLDIAIRAFAQANATNSILVIVFPMGIYNDTRYLRELLQLLNQLALGSRVLLCTGVTHDERFRFFRAADVFIMSSTK